MKQFILAQSQYWQIVGGVMLLKGVKDIEPYSLDGWLGKGGEPLPFTKFYREGVNPHRLGALAAAYIITKTDNGPEPEPEADDVLAYLERILLTAEGRRRR
jgi:hypothetical protein